MIGGADTIPTVEEIDAWLFDKGTTLWGDFIVSDDDGRRRAAEWMHGELTSLHAHRAKASVK